MDRGRFLPSEVRRRGVDELDRNGRRKSRPRRTLCEGPLDRRLGARVLGADVQDDPVSADGVGGQVRSVEDEVRAVGEERPVLCAQGLPLRAVDEDHGVAVRATRDRRPLPPDREARAAPPQEAAGLDHRGQSATIAELRKGTQPVRVIGERFGASRERGAVEQAQH